MSSLSFTCIGYNEIEHLKILLPQLIANSNEVIYVDCESFDNSLDYAKSIGCKVFSQKNNTNLNINKTYGIEKSSSEWIFYIDPDERLSLDLLSEIHSKIRNAPKENAFKLPRKNYFFGKWLRYGNQYPDYQLRLFRKGKAYFKNEHVHEKLQVEGKIGGLSHPMKHYPFLTVSQFISKFDFYSGFAADYMGKKNIEVTFYNSLRYLFLIPFNRFFKRYFFYRGFLDGIPGFFAAFFDASQRIVRYVKLWEKKYGYYGYYKENKKN